MRKQPRNNPCLSAFKTPFANARHAGVCEGRFLLVWKRSEPFDSRLAANVAHTTVRDKWKASPVSPELLAKREKRESGSFPNPSKRGYRRCRRGSRDERWSPLDRVCRRSSTLISSSHAGKPSCAPLIFASTSPTSDRRSAECGVEREGRHRSSQGRKNAFEVVMFPLHS